MAKTGPPPTSKAMLERRGSWRAKHRPAELTAVGKPPVPPRYLSRVARAEWDRVVSIYALQGTLSVGDQTALTILAMSWDDYRVQQKREQELLGLKASLYGSDLSMILRRIQSAKNEAFGRWSNLAARFGLTPADRPRVKVTTPTTQDRSKRGKDRFKPKLVG